MEFRAEFPELRVGTFDTELVHEFFWKLAMEARMNLHVILHYGRNTHHMIEALFKALGRALDEAMRVDPRVTGDSVLQRGACSMIAVIDYGMGNLHSVSRALERMGFPIPSPPIRKPFEAAAGLSCPGWAPSGTRCGS